MSVKYIVCPACDGEGYVSALAAFTAADLDNDYGDDYGAREEFGEEYARRGGVYDTACELCAGERVVTRKDAADWEELAEYRAEQAMVARYESVGY